MRRRDAMAPFDLQQTLCGTIQALTNPGIPTPADCAPNVATIAEVCKSPQAAQYFVFESDNAEGAVSTWRFRARDARNSLTFQLYDCARLQGPTSANAATHRP